MDNPDSARVNRLRRLAAVGMLTQSFGHELNNVLGSILGTAQLMAMRETNPDVRERIAVIVQSVQRGISLTKGLSTIAAGGLPAHHPTDLHELINALATDGVLKPAAAWELKAHKTKVWIDGSALREALYGLAELLSDTSEIALSTCNRASASGLNRTDSLGDSWICLTLRGTRLPTAEERLLITNPLAAGTATSEILLAGSAAVIKQGRGRIVLDGPHDRSELSLYLPTAT